MNNTADASHCVSWRNATASSPLRYWSEVGFLCAFNVFVVIGNCFVLIALLIDRHLRTPTHYFIGSLAVADLALGLLVLPFATTLQIQGRWMYGSMFCQTWLTFDIWLCTASIYSLIAVTFDRYVAVTKPLTYKLVMTRRKASVLIVAVWSVAVVICLPAFAFSLHRTYRVNSVTCQCTQMAHSAPYIAYSSIGSFYLPMVVIVYLYARIYTTVRKIRLSGSTGIVSMTKSAMANGCGSAANSKQCLQDPQHDTLLEKGPQLSGTLRVHRGKYQAARGYCSKRSNTVERLSADRLAGNGDQQNPQKNQTICDKDKPCERMYEIVVVEQVHLDEQNATPGSDFGTFNGDNLDVRYLTAHSAGPSCQSSASNSPRGSMAETKLFEDQINMATSRVSSAAGRANPATVAADLWLHIIMPSQLTSLWCQRMTVFQKYQKKFALELKALKTVCTVTGCFFACWLGFCIVYTMQVLPYCRSAPNWPITGSLLPQRTPHASPSWFSSIGSCVPDWVTNIMVWLGYVNSGLNPIIYGILNKHFRRTFRRILRCDVSMKGYSHSVRRKETMGRKRSL